MKTKWRTPKTRPAMKDASAAALPDIVFMLLFFFMAATTIKEFPMKVRVVEPLASEVERLENRSLSRTISIGQPLLWDTEGTDSRIQLNDHFADLEDIYPFIEASRKNASEADRHKLMTTLKVDQETRMKKVSEVKQELRKAHALKIMYATRNDSEKNTIQE